METAQIAIAPNKKVSITVTITQNRAINYIQLTYKTTLDRQKNTRTIDEIKKHYIEWKNTRRGTTGRTAHSPSRSSSPFVRWSSWGGRADDCRARRLRGWRDCTTAAVMQRCRHQLWGERSRKWNWLHGGAREQSIAASLQSDVTMPSKRNKTRIKSYISARKRQRLQSHFIPSEGEQQNSGLEPISTLPHHQSHAHRMWRQKYSAADRNNRTPLAPRRQT